MAENHLRPFEFIAGGPLKVRRTGVRRCWHWFLFLLVLLWPISAAYAETLVLEVERAEAGFDRRTGEPIVTIRYTESSGRIWGSFTATGHRLSGLQRRAWSRSGDNGDR